MPLCESCSETFECIATARRLRCVGHLPDRPDRSIFRLEDGPNGDRFRWRWQGGADVDEAFLDPLRASGARLCVYEGDRTLFGAHVPAGDRCDGACWRSTARGRFVYRDDDGSVAGITKIILDPGRRGTSSITVSGGGPLLNVPPPPLELPVTVQLQQDDGRCWEARYEPAGVTKNVAGLFRGAAASP